VARNQRSMRELINGRPILRLRDRFAALFGDFQPRRLGDLHLPNRLFRRVAAGRTEFQVRNVGDVAGVVVAVENVDMVILHGSSPTLRIEPPSESPRVSKKRNTSSSTKASPAGSRWA